jgi:dCTP deaminase
MIASAHTLRKIQPVSPFVERGVTRGRSYGLSLAGYDIRHSHTMQLAPGMFRLGSSLEKFTMPKHLLGIVHDKSTWARQGLAVQNTVIEPGWEGYLTLEFTNHSDKTLYIEEGDPIAQVIFHFIDVPTPGYTGKYQNQQEGPQGALFE